jgi:hypothetical protein
MTFLGHQPNGYKLIVDHINKNKIDNRIENLQIITQRENISRSIDGNFPTGVIFHKYHRKYQARILIDKKRKSLGYFSTPEEASQAYQNALKNLI